MRKSVLIGVIVAFVVFLIAVAVYVIGFDYKIEIEGAPSDGFKVEYGETFELPKIKAFGKGYLFNSKKHEAECEVENNVDTSKLGKYEVKISASYKKKTLKKTIEVVVADTKAPAITLAGDSEMTVEAGTEFSDPGYTAEDNYDGDVTDKVSVDGDVDTKKCGDYTIKYSVSDSSENESQEERVVHVADTTAPQITLSGNENTYVQIGSTYEEPGYTAQDNCDGDVTDDVKTSGKVDTSKEGQNTIKYTVSDSAGNEATVERNVMVYDPQSASGMTPTDKVVYLTFDDGPGKYTQQLLDVLDKYGVKATFFVTNEDPDYQDMIAKEAEAGHTVAIHSASHDYPKIYQSTDAYMADLYEMNDIIKAQTGKSASIIRFPGGASNTVSAKYCKGIMTQLVSLVEASGFQYCDWNVSSGDAGETKYTDDVYNNVISGIQKHKVSVVLQHDIKKFSVDAVERIIQWGQANGYTFLPLTPTTEMVHHKVNN